MHNLLNLEIPTDIDTDTGPKYAVAIECELDNQDTSNKLKNFKAICDSRNPDHCHNVVKRGYKIAQHDEVVDKVSEAVEDLGLRANKKITEMNEGGRIHMEMIFPDLAINVGDRNDILNLRITVDNSYDATSGLRLNIGAFRLVCSNGMYVGEKFAKYYHRHTKGLDCNDLEKSIEKGVDIFQNKLLTNFNAMQATEVDPTRVHNFLNQCIDDKVIPVKYLQMMVDTLSFGSSVDIVKTSQVNTQWQMFNLITETLSHNNLSVDRQRSLTETMYSKILRSAKDTAPMVC